MMARVRYISPLAPLALLATPVAPLWHHCGTPVTPGTMGSAGLIVLCATSGVFLVHYSVKEY